MIDAAREHRHAVVIGGGLLGLEAANGLKLRGMDVTVVHLMPWLMERQLDRTAARPAAAIARSEGPRVPPRSEDGSARRRRVGPRRARCGSPSGETLPADLVVMAVGIRPNVALAQGRRPALRPRHRRQRHAADVRSAHLRDRRMRRASRARPTGSSRRCSRWRRSAPTTSPDYGIGRYAGSQTVDQAQGHRRRPLLRRRFHGRRRTPRRSCSPIRRGGVYKKLVLKRRQARRRRAVRRHRRRRVVLQAAARRPQRRRDPRPADVRRGEPRRHRPPGPDRARSRWPTTPRCAAATACARARSSRRSRTRACSRSTTCASTPRRRRRAARARAWSSSS